MHQKECKSISANWAEMVDWSSPEFLEVYRRELVKLADFYLQNPDIEKCSLFDVYFPALLDAEPKKWCGSGTNMEVMDEYTRIVEDKTPLGNYSDEEKFERLRTLEAIEKIADVLKL